MDTPFRYVADAQLLADFPHAGGNSRAVERGRPHHIGVQNDREPAGQAFFHLVPFSIQALGRYYPGIPVGSEQRAGY